ncbi:signal peptidase I [Natrarchaeobaculum aegyptiacum]|uniref:Signal peptidase I n=1 Tax=Natrarchaeobaculum aegyptiacum TaxID=745377 RepID=A0A2Z2HSV6_9EURY|nr:signal peptidase I [Natrarchaeobaculum aegyptiacum]ARS90301.1 signal peptidase I [Natrarchaeobaculum aegyptiacum]
MRGSIDTGWGIGSQIAVLLAILVCGALLAGNILGVPILLSYVESGSMEPTIETGDGFVAIPTADARSVETGDVVVFEAEEADGGGLTTHRIVDETEQGYVTRGDANPVTDQDAGEPYVTDGQIVATAMQFDGGVVTIPHLGTAAMTVSAALATLQWQLASLLGTDAILGTSGLGTLLLVGGLVVIAASFRSGARRREVGSRTRSRRNVFDARRVVLAVAVLLFAVTLATTLAMSGSTELGVVSAEFDSERPDVIPAGESEVHTFELHNVGVVPVVSIVEPASGGIDVDGGPHTLGHGESANATVEISAPDERGYYLRSFAEYRYFAVLPPPLLAELHAIHPWVATTATATVVTGVFTLPLAIVVGTGSIAVRDRKRSDGPGSLLR